MAETVAFVMVLVGLVLAYEIGRTHERTRIYRQFMAGRGVPPSTPRPPFPVEAAVEEPPTNRRT